MIFLGVALCLFACGVIAYYHHHVLVPNRRIELAGKELTSKGFKVKSKNKVDSLFQWKDPEICLRKEGEKWVEEATITYQRKSSGIFKRGVKLHLDRRQDGLIHQMGFAPEYGAFAFIAKDREPSFVNLYEDAKENAQKY